MTELQQVGRLVGGRYRLVRALGAGGFGSVWLAHDETLGVDVAVKEVRLPAGGTERERAELLQRAHREARHAARLRDHPHVVGVHDVLLDGGAPWTVMQLIVGRSLDERVAADGPLPTAEAARIAAAVLDALGAAHRAGIVHRDVKPANILLADDGRVLLADFGIAVQQDQTALTATGTFLGSIDYVAPERARGAADDPASDLFSLGATLYRAVEGRLPFRRDTPVGTLTAVLFEPAPPCRLAGPLAPLIDGLLAKDPATRLTGPAAIALLAALPTTAPHDTLPPPRPAAAATTPAPAAPSLSALPAPAPTATGPHHSAPSVPWPPAPAPAPTAATARPFPAPASSGLPTPAAAPPVPAGRRSALALLPPLAVLALLGAAMPLNALMLRPDSRLPPSTVAVLRAAHAPVFTALGLDRFPAFGSSDLLSWLWLLPTLAALVLTAALPPKAPTAARVLGLVLSLLLPVRLLLTDLRADGERVLRVLPDAVASHVEVVFGPGWWLLHLAALAAPAALLAQHRLARRNG
ncbi:serine/threonine-protein kinase [Kitasatospora sp. NPDC088391]|uniref:serine/threonine-protein kinase n=1 Tax=Kitasatospora sp. NPDC088391 TaxID=3364074 RepID=UPI0037FD111D